jgi:RNA polymerase sigma factor (sigma-70 family)
MSSECEVVPQSLNALAAHVRRLAAAQASKVETDARLLERFAKDKDATAFATIMDRHGGLVWSVCRNVLRRQEDVEDAFQAVFLVLIQKPAAVRRRESLASWLYGVAFRTAMKARRSAVRRRSHEGRVQMRAVEQPVSVTAFRELHAMLSDEIRRLPEKYGAPFILCALEGKSRQEAARELGWKETTVAGRLAQARRLLQQRLARHGLALSTAVCGTALLQQAPAKASVTLKAALVRAATGDVKGPVSVKAIALARSVLKTMAVGKMTAWSALVATLGILAGGVVAHQATAPHQVPPAEQSSNASLAVGQPKPTATQLARTDQYGDALPAGAIARIGSRRWWHGSGEQGCSLMYTPDGRNLAYCDAGKAVCISDAATGKEVRRIGPDNDLIRCFAISPDGKVMVTGNWDSSALRVWDVATGKELCRVPTHDPGTNSVAFDCTGTMFAAVTGQRAVRLWDTATWQQVKQLETSWAWSIAFLRDGKTLITAGDKGIRWWDLLTCREIRRLHKKLEPDRRLLLSPDGKILAAMVEPRELYLWEAATGKEMSRNVLGPDGTGWYLSFSPDGGTIVCSNCGEGGVPPGAFRTRFFETATGREVRSWRENSPCGPIVYSSDSKTVAQVIYQRICVRDAKTGKETLQIPGLPAYVMSVGFTEDGKKLFASCRGGQTGVWDPFTGEQLAAIRPPSQEFAGPSAMLLGPAMSANGEKAALVDAKGILSVWRPATKEILCRIGDPPVGDDQANFSPDGRTLVVKHRDDVLRLWDTTTGKLRCSLPKFGSLRFPHPHAFSKDGRVLAVAPSCMDKSIIRLFDTATGGQIGQLAWQEDNAFPTCLAFSPDDKYLVATDGPNHRGPGLRNDVEPSLRLWHLPTGREVRRVPIMSDRVRSIVFSPDGKTVAAPEGETIGLWETASGKERGRLPGHSAWVWTLAFSPNGRLLASGGLDYTALVWDITSICPDGQWSFRDLPQAEAEQLWTELGDPDGVKSYRAMWRLVAGGHPVSAFLSKRLRPEPEVDKDRIRRLVAGLDDRRFEVREQSSSKLQELGELADSTLREALAEKPSPEARRRLASLLDRAEKQTLSSGQLHSLRGLEVLEHIGDRTARKALTGLSQGAPAARLTQEANAALGRLARNGG